MRERKGTQIATRVMPKCQKGAGSAGMFVMPKTEVTKVSGLGWLVSDSRIGRGWINT